MRVIVSIFAHWQGATDYRIETQTRRGARGKRRAARHLAVALRPLAVRTNDALALAHALKTGATDGQVIRETAQGAARHLLQAQIRRDYEASLNAYAFIFIADNARAIFTKGDHKVGRQ